MATRLMLVSGFLGAGKTTLLLQSARLLAEKGYRVGIVTNDQAQDLVDTAMAYQQNIPVMEVAGGCFCCRFPTFLASVRRLQETVGPDVILGEPVGSCTDLVSTIFRPLHVYYPAQFQVAPLTVLVDPLRDPSSFPAEVEYIYDKQLTEANIIAVSKVDILDPSQAQVQVQALQERYPTQQVFSLSAKTCKGLDEWLDTCLRQSSNIEQILDMNYDIYAQGEAYLGWLNAKGTLLTSHLFSPTDWIMRILKMIEQGCASRGAAVAHIKIHLTAGVDVWKVSLTQLGHPASWDLAPTNSRTDQAHFIVNARVNTTPATLEALVRQAFAEIGGKLNVHTNVIDLACFSPLPPRPTYRLLQA